VIPDVRGLLAQLRRDFIRLEKRQGNLSEGMHV